MSNLELNLPDLDAPVIVKPDHIVNPFAGQRRTPAHRIALLRKPDRWEWAHVLRAVTGWTVVSAGTLDPGVFPDADAAGEYLVRQFLGDNGDGFDRLSHEAYLQKGRIAHLRQETHPHIAYCGESGGPAVFDTAEPEHAQQHCIACDRRYRAEHYGRTPVTY